MNASWDDIERALADGSLDQRDKATLEAFSQVEPRPSGNPAYHIRYEQAQRRIAQALARIDAGEREEAERVRHEEVRSRLDELRRPHWTVLPNFWLTAAGAIAAVVAAYLAWLSLKK